MKARVMEEDNALGIVKYGLPRMAISTSPSTALYVTVLRKATSQDFKHLNGRPVVTTSMLLT